MSEEDTGKPRRRWRLKLKKGHAAGLRGEGLPTSFLVTPEEACSLTELGIDPCEFEDIVHNTIVRSTTPETGSEGKDPLSSVVAQRTVQRYSPDDSERAEKVFDTVVGIFKRAREAGDKKE